MNTYFKKPRLSRLIVIVFCIIYVGYWYQKTISFKKKQENITEQILKTTQIDSNNPNRVSAIRNEINREVQSKINQWLIKGEFEKTSDFSLRTNKDSIRSMKMKYENEVIEKIVDRYDKNININDLRLGRYNADSETFLIELKKIGKVIFPVPYK